MRILSGNGRYVTQLPRQGILRVVKRTGARLVPTRAITAPHDALADFTQQVEQGVQCFRGEPVTPPSFLKLENERKAAADDTCRQVLEQEANRREPEDKSGLPGRVRYHKENYRINKKTPATIATRFGNIPLRSLYYLNEEDGEPGLHPLWIRLGIGAGAATPALGERVARTAVDHPQTEVRVWLVREHGRHWSNDRLRTALAGFRQALMPFVPALQQERLLTWLAQAEVSRGRHRPVLAVGRDGIMIPMRAGGYQEGSTATLSV